jgi:hypothetical protein
MTPPAPPSRAAAAVEREQTPTRSLPSNIWPATWGPRFAPPVGGSGGGGAAGGVISSADVSLGLGLGERGGVLLLIFSGKGEGVVAGARRHRRPTSEGGGGG